VRGADLCEDLIGKLGFVDYFHLLVTGRRPDAVASRVLDATLVAIAEHGLVPSVQASRMTLAAAPDAIQGAVAAGILGCGPVILGASETAGRLFRASIALAAKSLALERRRRSGAQNCTRQAIPGYGHPQQQGARPARRAPVRGGRARLRRCGFVPSPRRSDVLPGITGRDLRLNVSAAIPAVLLTWAFRPRR
jgi:citrate synthase